MNEYFDHEFGYGTYLELKILIGAFDCLNITSVSPLGCSFMAGQGPHPWMALGLAPGWPLAWSWLALGLALAWPLPGHDWPLAWPWLALAGPWP